MPTEGTGRPAVAEQPLGAVLADLASADPVPGGGSAAALAAATGAALVAMVAGLGPNPARRTAPAVAGKLAEIAERAQRLQQEALVLYDADADAYAAVVFALRRPQHTEPERTERQALLRDALIRATDVPLATMALAAEVARLAADVAGGARPAARADLSVAVLVADAALRGAAGNVWSNVQALPAADAGFAETARAKARTLVEQCGTLSGRLLAELGATAAGRA